MSFPDPFRAALLETRPAGQGPDDFVRVKAMNLNVDKAQRAGVECLMDCQKKYSRSLIALALKQRTKGVESIWALARQAIATTFPVGRVR